MYCLCIDVTLVISKLACILILEIKEIIWQWGKDDETILMGQLS